MKNVVDFIMKSKDVAQCRRLWHWNMGLDDMADQQCISTTRWVYELTENSDLNQLLEFDSSP